MTTIRNAIVELLFWLIARIGFCSDMHHYSASLRWDEEEGEYMATAPAWGSGISTFAPTAHKALYELGIVVQMCVEIEQDDGRPLPPDVPATVIYAPGVLPLYVDGEPRP